MELCIRLRIKRRASLVSTIPIFNISFSRHQEVQRKCRRGLDRQKDNQTRSKNAVSAQRLVGCEDD